ncbi:MAG: zinc ribbon domain-containing protein [Sporomusaceae bacterium]|nr:zinc ribbon domain-containing protein [Sporomusaceae bacterium]
MKCFKCGHEILNDASFCPNCGIRLNGDLNVKTGPAQQHLKNASENIAAAMQEISVLPNIGIKVAAVLNIIGLIVFFFPWAGMFGFSVSGFSVATNPSLFGSIAMLLLLLPISCITALYTYYRLNKALIDILTARQYIQICGTVALIVQALIYIVEIPKFHGFDIFTGWFYFEFLIWIGVITMVFWDKKQQQERQ